MHTCTLESRENICADNNPIEYCTYMWEIKHYTKTHSDRNTFIFIQMTLFF